MARRPRHGLHLVPDRPASPDPPRLVVHQDTVVLRLEGRLDGVTGADLRLLLAPFTVDGGPFELVLDLSGVDCICDGGLDAVLETAEALTLRGGVLRLSETSPAVDVELGRLHGGHVCDEDLGVDGDLDADLDTDLDLDLDAGLDAGLDERLAEQLAERLTERLTEQRTDGRDADEPD